MKRVGLVANVMTSMVRTHPNIHEEGRLGSRRLMSSMVCTHPNIQEESRLDRRRYE